MVGAPYRDQSSDVLPASAPRAAGRSGALRHDRSSGPYSPAPGQALSFGRPGFAPLIYLSAIVAAELIVTFGDARWGIALHACILSAMLVHAALVRGEALRRLLLALSLAPLVRILSLSLPLQHVQLLYWYVIVAAPLVVATVLVARTLGLSRRDLGLVVQHVPNQALVIIAGIGLGMIEYAILQPQPLVQQLNGRAVWLPALILLVGTGFTEELVFRGVMQSAARGVMGRLTILYVSLVFASLHIGYRSAVDLLFVFFVGLFFAITVQRTGSILGTTLAHGAANIVLYLVMPFIGLGAAAPPSVIAKPPAAVTAPVASSVPAPSLTPAANVPLSLTPAAIVSSLTPSAPPAIPIASPAQGEPLPQPEALETHIVAPGETLSSIAIQYRTTVDQLARLNRLSNPDQILAGQPLLVPAPPR